MNDASTSGVAISLHNPPGLAQPFGYSHVAEIRGGRVIYIAGQLAIDESGALVGAGSVTQQAEQVYTNLGIALGAVGATFANVVKTTIYVVDMTTVGELRAVRDRYLFRNPPTSTLIQVAGLFRPEFLLEIDAVAVI